MYFNGKLQDNQLTPNFNDFLRSYPRATIYKQSQLYDEYLEFGGFPEVALTADYETKRLIIRNIFSSFFEKDIKVFTELKDVRELRDMILLLASRNGNILDVTRLASELSINRVKAYGYIEFLEGTFFLRLIPKYSKSIDRSVAGGKKVYFSDTGLLNLVTKVTPGQLLEVAVANQLQQYGKLSFFNKRNTAEIDFILDKEIAIEVKHRAIEPDMSRLKKITGSLGLPQYYILSKTPTDMDRVVYPWFL